ncbi:MAG: mismatch-specific DNA-glycosylase [Gammaproteobacteria bacterium]|jgi:TDG/mug DNA glycosylase family protein
MSGPAETLPDYLGPGLEIVSIGLNPSLPSVRAGFYFANPRNRFWRALNASGLVPVRLTPGVAAMETLFAEYRIGFTDVVKRPTAGGAELRADDYRVWAPVLKGKLESAAPAIIWFHGKQAWVNYLKYAEGLSARPQWGAQPFRRGPGRVFVTPNPSPANAAYSLASLTHWYRRLGSFRDRLVRAGASRQAPADDLY